LDFGICLTDLESKYLVFYLKLFLGRIQFLKVNKSIVI